MNGRPPRKAARSLCQAGGCLCKAARSLCKAGACGSKAGGCGSGPSFAGAGRVFAGDRRCLAGAKRAIAGAKWTARRARRRADCAPWILRKPLPRIGPGSSSGVICVALVRVCDTLRAPRHGLMEARAHGPAQSVPTAFRAGPATASHKHGVAVACEKWPNAAGLDSSGQGERSMHSREKDDCPLSFPLRPIQLARCSEPK